MNRSGSELKMNTSIAINTMTNIDITFSIQVTSAQLGEFMRFKLFAIHWKLP